MTIKWPTLWLTQDEDGSVPVPQIGIPDLEWNGQSLDIPTVEQWELTMGRDELHTLTIRIPVIVRTRPRSK